METITQEIEKLRVMLVPELIERYEIEFGKPPRVKNRVWLWRRIAWKVQERKYGGLSETAKKNLEELISQIDLPLTEQQRTVSDVLKKPRRPGLPSVGSVITRRWHDEDLQLRVVE